MITQWNKSKKLHEACSKDDLRPVLNYVQFKDGRATATDGHILVSIKDDEITGEHYLHREYMQEVCKGKVNDTSLIDFDELKILRVADGLEIKITDEEQQYPNWDRVVPKYETPLKIAVDAKLVARLAKALGDDELILHIDAPDGAIYVESYNQVEHEEVSKDDRDFAILMPIRLDKALTE